MQISRTSGFLILVAYDTWVGEEICLPDPAGGLAYVTRKRSPAEPWSAAVSFGTSLGQVTGMPSLIQSDYGAGNREVLARFGDHLAHFWRDGGGNWQGPNLLDVSSLGITISGSPALAQAWVDSPSKNGNFEVLVPVAPSGVAHLRRDNSSATQSWSVVAKFGGAGTSISGLGTVDALALRVPEITDADFDTTVLEAAVRQGQKLSRFAVTHSGVGEQATLTDLTTGVAGAPGLARRSAAKNRLDLVTPMAAGGLSHISADGDLSSASSPVSFGNELGKFTAASVAAADHGLAPAHALVAAGYTGTAAAIYERESQTEAWPSAASDWVGFVGGVAVKEFAAIDDVMSAYVRPRNFQATLAIRRNGTLVFERSYGAPAPPPDAWMRLASVSKAFTCAAIQTARDATPALLKMTDTIFSLLDISTKLLASQTVDSRISSVTIQNLVDHLGGWDRAVDGDPVFQMRDIATALNLAGPLTKWDLARYMYGQRLNFKPGQVPASAADVGYVYSNFGYVLLALAIEKVSGKPFIGYLLQDVMGPLGNTDLGVARTLASERGEREVSEYHNPGSGPTALDWRTSNQVPAVRGGDQNLTETMDGGGGVMASAAAVTALIHSHAAWGLGGRAPGSARTGGEPGTQSIAVSRWDGLDWAYAINGDDPAGAFPGVAPMDPAAGVSLALNWSTLGGSVDSGAGACSWAKDRMDVFARSGGLHVAHISFQDSSGWSSWELLDPPPTAPAPGQAYNFWGRPAAATWGANRLDVCVQGHDNAIWHNHWDGSTWSSWESLGGTFALDNGPALATWGTNRLDVFARGRDNALWHRYYDGSWHNWESLGGHLASAPVAVSWGTNRIDVFAQQDDSSIVHKAYDSSGWHNWESISSTMAWSAPTAATWGQGRLDVVALGVDGQLHRRWWEGVWSPWVPLGAPPASSGVNINPNPGAVARKQGLFEVFAVTSNGKMWHSWN